jgi:hypothetical protein
LKIPKNKDLAVRHQDSPLNAEFLKIYSDPFFANQVVWSDFNYFGAKKISNENAKERLKNAIKDNLPLQPIEILNR